MSLSIEEKEEEGGEKERVVGGDAEGRIWDGWMGGMMTSLIFDRVKS